MMNRDGETDFGQMQKNGHRSIGIDNVGKVLT